MIIEQVIGREILDSRGNPRWKWTWSLKTARWAVPPCLPAPPPGHMKRRTARRRSERYGGKGVQHAVKNVNE